MPPTWMAQLVKARQAQEDGATQRLALARRARQKAKDAARQEAARIDALGRRNAALNSGAFVAAAVALQAAAATHSAAVCAAAEADGWVDRRSAELTTAATARWVAETMRDRADAAELVRLRAAEQLTLDETAATRHLAAQRRRQGSA